MMPLTPPTARTYAWLALGTLAFILYGSLVPFEFRARSDGDVLEAFTWAMTQRLHIESRSDALANILLGVPLGFSLLAWTCVDRGSWRREVILGLAFLPGCVAFSALVEFLQLYCPQRTCAGSDVLMQGIGTIIGMTGWMAVGQTVTMQARRLWAGPGIGGSAGRMLVVYLGVLASLQALPLDLTLSPRDVYKNLRDKVHYTPFGEFRGLKSEAEFWDHATARIATLGIYLPVGLLAGCMPGRFWQTGSNAGRIFALALGLGAVMEGIQVFVMSRLPNSSDALIGAASVVLGWWLARNVRDRKAVLVLGCVWAFLLFVVYWQPYAFSATLGRVEWLVLLPLENRNPFTALGDLLSKLVLFSLLGVVVAALTRGQSARVRLVKAAATGLGVSLGIELGQLFQPAHTPSATDVTLGGVGAWFGATAALRVCPDSALLSRLNPRRVLN